MTEKSRHIPLSELYSNLQLEYISYFLRAKIYCKEFSTSYKEICDKKKEKIEKISINNGLPSIFNSSEKKQRYIDKFFNKSGIPNFTYKDEFIRAKLSGWDKHYFFQKGSSVKFTHDGSILVGKVSSNDKSRQIVYVTDEDNVERCLHYNNITRIFSEEYFNF